MFHKMSRTHDTPRNIFLGRYAMDENIAIGDFNNLKSWFPLVTFHEAQ